MVGGARRLLMALSGRAMLALSMSAFRGKADMTRDADAMSANDPKRTFVTIG